MSEIVNLAAEVDADEHGHTGEGVWEQYIELLTDPAHLMLEATLILAIDVLLLAILWPFVIKPLFNKLLHREHRILDAEHGVKHDGDVLSASSKVTDSMIVDSLVARRNVPEVDALLEALLRNRQKD